MRKLNGALDAAGIDAWVDWEGIPPSADWMKEIKAAIREADAFIFVISPHSLASKVCAEELNLCLEYQKKLVPVLYSEPEKRAKIHPKLKSINWVYARSKRDDFKEAISKVLDSIQTDLAWVQQHTRLLSRASEWNEKKRNASYLLRGADLEEAQHWMTGSSSVDARAVLPLQAEYIAASHRAAVGRLRGLAFGIGIAFLISLALGAYAFQQRDLALQNWEEAQAKERARATQQFIAEESMRRAEESMKRAEASMDRAEKSEQIAQAQRSTALAKIYQNRVSGLSVSSLLAMDAYQQLPNLPDAEQILRHNISLLADPVKQINAGGQISIVKRSPDGKKFVAANSDGSVCAWGFADGARYFCVEKQGLINDIEFSRDGSAFVTAADNGDVVFWNAENGEKIKTFRYEKHVWDLAAHPNEIWLGIGTSDGYGLLDIRALREIYFYRGYDIRKLAFDPFGKYMAFAARDGNVSLWEIFTNNTPAGLLHKNAATLDVAYSPLGKWVVSAGTDSMARLLRVETRKMYSIAHGDWVRQVAFGPEDEWFVTVSDDGLARVIDTVGANGSVNIRERLRLAHSGFVTQARVSYDGQWIATTGYDRTARIWDAFSGAELLRIPIEGIGAVIEFDAEADRLVVGDRSGYLALWDISWLHARGGLARFSAPLREMRFSPYGNWVAASAEDKKVWLIQTDLLGSANDQRRALPGIAGLTTKLAVSADAAWIAAVQYDNEKNIYNVVLAPVAADGTPITLETGQVSAVVFTPDSARLIVANEYGIISTWDIATRQKIESFTAGGAVTALAISPDGKYLAIGMEEGDYSLVWDLSAQTWQKLRQFGAILSVQFSADGNLLATGSSDATVFLWKAAESAFEFKTAFQVEGEARTLQFNPSNGFLAVGDSTGLAYLFDLAAGGEVARLWHAPEARSVSFSPDGTRLAVVSRNGINLWDMDAVPLIPKERLIETACSRLMRNLTLSEWNGIFSDRPYRLVCPPELTIGDD